MFANKTIYVYLDVNPKFENKAKYVFLTFARILNIDIQFVKHDIKHNIQVYYGKNIDLYYPINIYHDPEANAFFEEKIQYEINKINFVKNNDEYIPFLFSQNGMIFHYSPGKIQIRKDIISSAFYFLSGWDEYVERDNITIENRFKIEDTIQFKRNFVDLPIVDRYCEIFDRTVTYIFPGHQKTRRWEIGKKFVLSISHDVDYFPFWNEEHVKKINEYNIDRYKNSKGLVQKIKAIYKYFGHNVHKKWFYSDEMMLKKIIKIEKKLNVKSTFFLLAANNFEDKRQNYLAEENENLLKILSENDLGLHGSQKSSYHEENLVSEINCLKSHNIETSIYRTHYLAFNYHKSFGLLEKNGIKTDCSLGFWENVGYRAGISYPFKPYNIEEDREYDILEIPLIMMDTTLYSPRVLDLSEKEAWQKIKKSIDKAKKHHSHLSLLWHPTSFDMIDFGKLGKLYFKAIRYAIKKNGIIFSIEQFRNNWLDRIKNNKEIT